MTVVNGSQQVKGILSGGSLLFNEIITTTDMSRGANIDLVTGRFYYKVDNDNTFEFMNRIELQEFIESLDITSINNGSTTINNLISEELIQSYNILNLVNTTFFSLSDDTLSKLINLNFDTSSNNIEAIYILDKVNASIYKNGVIHRNEYQATPLLTLNTYNNYDIIDAFKATQFQNITANAIDSSTVSNIYMDNLLQQSAHDTSYLLDYLLFTNTNDNTLSIDLSNIIYNQFFSLNWLNYKLTLLNKKGFVSEFHNKIFAGESILYFLDRYVTVYENSGIKRVKLYFFDYRFLIHTNIFHILNYIKKIYNNLESYSNSLSENITSYKNANSIDLTTQQPKDYTSFEQDIRVQDIIEEIFDTDSYFSDKINQSALNVVIKIYKQNIESLSNSMFNDLDITSAQTFNYNGESSIQCIIDKLNLAANELKVPLIEFDVPLDGYFYFMI